MRMELSLKHTPFAVQSLFDSKVLLTDALVKHNCLALCCLIIVGLVDYCMLPYSTPGLLRYLSMTSYDDIL